jgi:hypothetical protein
VLKYKIGDIISYKHWISSSVIRRNEMIIENGIIISSSDSWEYNWIAKSFNTNELVHLKEDWITKLNED